MRIDQGAGAFEEYRLRPEGLSRFFGAAFLSFWLCGWAAGELFVIGVLGKGLSDLWRGELEASGGTIAIGLFLLVWLSLWTLGGLAAIAALLRLVWAEERLIVAPPGLRSVRRLGPLVWRRGIPRDELLGLRLEPRRGLLLAETASETITLATLGPPQAREDARRWLMERLGLDARRAEDEALILPEGWDEVHDEYGRLAATRDLRVRSKQARVATGVAALASLAALFFLKRAWVDPSLAALAAMALVAAGGLSYGAWRLAKGRDEWCADGGRLLLRRRSGARVDELFEARALVLSTSYDSDSDAWHRLDALAAGPGPRGGEPAKRKITSVSHDPREPRRLARWLSHHAAIPFEDRAEEKRREPDLDELASQLDESGALGRTLARFVRRAERRRRRRARARAGEPAPR